MRFNFKSIISYLHPTPMIGGLEISDSVLRYFLVKDKKNIQLSLRLPPHVVESGQVKDKKTFTAALSQFNKQIKQSISNSLSKLLTLDKEKIAVIATVNSHNVYLQTFTLPYLAINKLDEVAKLNLQMISPIDVKNAYYDWQFIGEGGGKKDQIDLLGAFIQADLANNYLEPLDQTGFSVVALEPTSLSLTRAIVKNYSAIDKSKPYLILLAGNDGLDLIVLRGGNLYFSRFISWPARTTDIVQSGGPENDLGKLINSEIQKVINFYYSRWGGQIIDLLLISPTEVSSLEKAVSETGLNMKKLSSVDVNGADLSWLACLGAALRGLTARSEDNLISLTSLGTEEEHRRQQVIFFASFWQKVFVVAVGIILALNVSVNIFLSSLNKKLESQLSSAGANEKIIKNLTELEQSAREFNSLIEKAQFGKKNSLKWMSIFDSLWHTAGNNIAITRLHFDPAELNLLVGGNSVTELEIINFKNRLSQDNHFENIVLPLAQIIRDGSRVGFQMSVKVRS